MIPFFLLLIASWLFYRLAWMYDKGGLKFAFIGAGIFSLLFLTVSSIVWTLFSEDLGDEISSVVFGFYIDFLFFNIDFILLFFIVVPVSVVYFIIYKAVEYRWKQQETDKSKNQEKLLDN